MNNFSEPHMAFLFIIRSALQLGVPKKMSELGAKRLMLALELKQAGLLVVEDDKISITERANEVISELLHQFKELTA